MYRIVQIDKLCWGIYAPCSHKPFATYPTLAECTDVLFTTTDCKKIIIIPKINLP